MQKLVVICLALGMGTAFLSGCDKKKAEVKTETTTTTPEGSTTETHVDKVETNK